MADKFMLKIVTPSDEVYSGEVLSVFLKGPDGEFEILAHHEDMISATVPSIARFQDAQGNDKKLFVSGSIVKVARNSVVICTDAAEFAENIDFKRAEEAKERALKQLESPDIFDKERVKLSLLRAEERLKLKQ